MSAWSMRGLGCYVILQSKFLGMRPTVCIKEKRLRHSVKFVGKMENATVMPNSSDNFDVTLGQPKVERKCRIS